MDGPTEFTHYTKPQMDDPSMVQKREKSEKLLRIVMICAKEYLNKLVLVMIYIVKKLFIRNIQLRIL